MENYDSRNQKIMNIPASTFPTTFEELLQWFPEYDYAHPLEPEKMDYRRPDNLTGYQQRCFIVKWAIEQCGRTGNVGLDIGSFGVHTPYCLSTDKFSTEHHPDYRGGQCIPQLKLSGEDLSLIGDATIPLITGNHVMEHLSGDLVTILRHWHTKLIPGGIVAQVIPDNAYSDVFAMDPTHTHNYSSSEFKEFILEEVKDIYDIVEFDSFDNHFSFNVVLKKK